jgi:hypothetical protein
LQLSDDLESSKATISKLEKQKTFVEATGPLHATAAALLELTNRSFFSVLLLSAHAVTFWTRLLDTQTKFR